MKIYNYEKQNKLHNDMSLFNNDVEHWKCTSTAPKRPYE